MRTSIRRLFSGGSVVLLFLCIVVMLGEREKPSDRYAQVILQGSSNDCGPAALAMILAYHGRDVQSTTLTDSFSLTDRGASVSEMIRMTRTYGIRASGWKLTPGDLERQTFPAIIFMDGDHYAVVDSMVAGAAYLRDPAAGRVVMQGEELRSRWDGTTVLFGEGPSMP